jgi:hypothetical protein
MESFLTIDIANIVYWIKEAFHTEPQSISGSLNFKRCMDAGTVIGYNREGEPTTFITVITDAGGTIKTAFPGLYSL